MFYVIFKWWGLMLTGILYIALKKEKSYKDFWIESRRKDRK